MVEDKKISESAELLLKGAKMLKYHCPDCLLPLFKDNERVFCPSCKTEYIIEESNVIPKAQVSETEKREEVTKRKKEIITESVLDNDLIKLIEKLIEKLVRRAMSSESLNEIREITEIVERLTHVLEKIKYIK